jgi:hypothetical protein
MEGLEPAHLSALDPKSSVSTNFTTSANFISTVKVSLNLSLLRFIELGVQRYLFILKNEMKTKKNIRCALKIVDKSFSSAVEQNLIQVIFGARNSDLC